MAAPDGSVLRQALDALLQLAAHSADAPAHECEQLPWTAQMQRAMAAAGMQFNPALAM